MNDNDKPFFQRKTTWAALLSAAGTAAAAAAGQVDVQTAVTAITQAILALCLRSAIAKQQ